MHVPQVDNPLRTAAFSWFGLQDVRCVHESFRLYAALVDKTRLG
jgi:hypothetical protein